MPIFVSLRRDEFEQLKEQAWAERRDPRAQAAVLLSKALSETATSEPARAVRDER